MDDALTTATKIEMMIGKIEALVEQIPEISMEKANGTSNYDRAMAITVLKLKNKQILSMQDLDGSRIAIDNPPATLIPLIAKGICYKEAFDKEVSEAGYKGIITMIDAHRAMLNGYQSIFKVLQ